MKKIPIEGMLVRHCGNHTHLEGFVEGTLSQSDEIAEEVIFDGGKTSVGGGSPKYSQGYDRVDWGN